MRFFKNNCDIKTATDWAGPSATNKKKEPEKEKEKGKRNKKGRPIGHGNERLDRKTHLMRPISEGPGASYRRDAAGRCDQSAMANGVSRTGRDSLRRPRLFSGIRSRATNQRRGNASHARDGVRDPLDFFQKFFGAMIMASRAITISAYNNQASSLATNYFFSLSAALFYVFNLITPFPL